MWKDFEHGALKDLTEMGSGAMNFELKPQRISRSVYGITGDVIVNEINFKDFEVIFNFNNFNYNI